MRGEDFLKIINDLDDELVDKADTIKKRSKFLPLIIGAACFATVILIIIGLLLLKKQDLGNSKTIDNAASENRATDVSDDWDGRGYSEGVIDDNKDSKEMQSDFSGISRQTEDVTEDSGITEEIYEKETMIDEEDNILEENDSEEDAQTNNDEERFAETTAVKYRVVSIDKASSEGQSTDNESWEFFWNDDYYNYYMHPGDADLTFVYYENGELEPLVAALSSGHISIEELDYYGIVYLKE